MTKQVTVTEARARLGELVDQVRYRGGGVLLTKNGKSVAAIVPASVYEAWRKDREKLREAVREIQSLNLGGDMTEEESIQWAVDLVHEVRSEIDAEKDPVRGTELIATH